MLSFPPPQEVKDEKNKTLKELDKVSRAQVCKYKNKQTDKKIILTIVFTLQLLWYTQYRVIINQKTNKHPKPNMFISKIYIQVSYLTPLSELAAF